MEMQKSFYEQNGGTYTQLGDLLLPDLVLDENEQQAIGKYGGVRKRYLKKHCPALYTNLLLSGALDQHLAEIDQACEERITRQMAKQEGVSEALKAADQMEWVRRMNSIRSRTEEIVLHELIYV